MTDNGVDGDNDRVRVNFFLPRPGFMRREVRLIKVMLLAWLVAAFGFPLLLAATARTPLGESAWTDSGWLGFPWHILVSGQGVILLFILICFVFNELMDVLIARWRRVRNREER